MKTTKSLLLLAAAVAAMVPVAARVAGTSAGAATRQDNFGKATVRRCRSANYTYSIQVAGTLDLTETAATGQLTERASWQHTWPQVPVRVKCQQRSGLVDVVIQAGVRGAELASLKYRDHIQDTPGLPPCDLDWDGRFDVVFVRGGGSYRLGASSSFFDFVAPDPEEARAHGQSLQRAFATQCRAHLDRGGGARGLPQSVSGLQSRGLSFGFTAYVDSFGGGKTVFPVDALARGASFSFVAAGARRADSSSGGPATVGGQIRYEFRRVGVGGGGVPIVGCGNVLRGTERPDRLRGTDAADLIRGLGGNDDIDGLGGNDCLYGDAGGDLLVGGSGVDTFDAGSGNDIIKARDGRAETVQCGAGSDTVVADKVDRLRNCEVVR